MQTDYLSSYEPFHCLSPIIRSKLQETNSTRPFNYPNTNIKEIVIKVYIIYTLFSRNRSRKQDPIYLPGSNIFARDTPCDDCRPLKLKTIDS